MRQGNLALEEKWQTHSCWFRLSTTLLGMSVTDCFLLAKYHGVLGYHTETPMSINFFAGVLGNQLISKAHSIAGGTARFLPEDDPILIIDRLNTPTISTMTEIPDGIKVLRKMKDGLGQMHTLVRYPKTTHGARRRTLSRPCKICCQDTEANTKKRKSMDAGQYCFECGDAMACCNTADRDCFSDHVNSFRRSSGRHGVST
jgi:hypothetical protein